jgi:hypothetical protein
VTPAPTAAPTQTAVTPAPAAAPTHDAVTPAPAPGTAPSPTHDATKDPAHTAPTKQTVPEVKSVPEKKETDDTNAAAPDKEVPTDKEAQKPGAGDTATQSDKPIVAADIDRVGQLETESAQLSVDAKAADPQLREARARKEKAEAVVARVDNELRELRPFVDAVGTPAEREPRMKAGLERAKAKLKALADVRQRLAEAQATLDQLASEQNARYEKVRANTKEIERIARPELALRPTLRGVANELRVLKEEGLLGIKQSFTVRDPKTGEFATTIPDGIRPKGGTVDVKDVIKLSETQQLRLQREVSRQSGQKPEIITGQKTYIPQDMRDNYIITQRPDLGPR